MAARKTSESPTIKKSKPETELLLDSLQEEYVTTRSPEVWASMFNVMVVYARSLTLKMNKGKVYLEPEHILGIATDAAIKIMERYKDPEFRILHSFAGLLKWKIIESLYGPKEEDMHLSLNHVLREDASSKIELGDLQSKLNLTTVNSQTESDDVLLVSAPRDIGYIVSNLLCEFDEACDSYRLSVLSRIYLLLWLRKSKIRNHMQSFKKNLDLSAKEEESLELLLLEMRNRIATAC